jgi:putative ABC transport system permease protein
MSARAFQIVIRSLRLLWRCRLRSTLLMTTAAIGVAGVVCSVNYGASGTKQLMDQIRRMGTNVLVVTPKQSEAVAGRARTGQLVTTLTDRDHSAVRRQIPSRMRSSALVNGSFRAKVGDLSKNATIVGCEPDYFAIKNWPPVTGKLFDLDQQRIASRVAILGHTVATDLFGSASPIGERLTINRVPFTVIGVLAERGQGLDVANEDEQIYVPLSTAMHRLMNLDHYAAIVIEIDSLDAMESAAKQLRSLLHQLHHGQPNRLDDFQVQNQKSLLDTQVAATKRLSFFLSWIAISALLVSGLGTLGITWIAVKERTREIGTRRALGAAEKDIFLQVASESTALAIIGCALGLALSWSISLGLSYLNGLSFVFVQESALLALFVAVTLNSGFALLPARKAASVLPTEAMRYE